MSVPRFAVGLCDDAAVFPPGSMPLPEAVPAHVRHKRSPYAALVGSFIVAAPALEELGTLLAGGDPVLDLVVTLPGGPDQLPGAVSAAAGLPVRLAGVEVAVPPGLAAADLLAALDRAAPAGVPVFVEVPRDELRPEIVAALPATPYRAKFRTGGVKAGLHPDEAELAAAIRAVVDAGVPFKATAGLHHAVRNTDPETGFEQHGFLNILLAVDAALAGAAEDDLVTILARRDGTAVAAGITDLDGSRAEAVRARFLSFGTCSITDPLADLTALGLADGEGDPA
ncbi:hypothetical protein [Actinomadura rugatobispora]|uniref:Uncharacterized protein n=1 Tax=Actinomadura rugatobispora TaxID=1994 RepID=A0ABW1AB05_9ACTN|nr:hypothetical protein GCM10010200_047940 [Actinomadura rugatobispora]